jgi:hypothetical protein
MPKVELEVWLREREPAPPAVFLPRLLAAGGGTSDPGSLMEGGIEAVTSALGRPGRDREAAFQLLTADALLTYACESLAGSADPGRRLRQVVERVGEKLGS